MLFEYENELYPFPEPDSGLFDRNCLESMSTEEIERAWNKAILNLEKLRKEEPAKKRRRLFEYRCWVSRVHSCIRDINLYFDELQRRKSLDAVHPD